MDFALVVAALVLFALPWAVLRLAAGEREASAEDAVDAFALGTGAAFVLLQVCGRWSLWAYLPVWGAGAIAAGLAVARRRPRLRFDAAAGWLAAVLAAVLVLRLVAAEIAEYPYGWDAYFHLVLADKTLETGRQATDWLPHEAALVNYPPGVHLLLALVGGLTGAPLHRAFNASLLFFSVAAAAQLYSLASRAAGGRAVALPAALSFALLAFYGGWDVYLWGGLPHMAGLQLFLALLTLAAAGAALSHFAFVGSFGVLFGALCVVHHHWMLTAGLVFATLGVRYLLRSGERPRAWRLAAGGVAGLLLVSAWLVPYALRVGTLGGTAVASYLEPMLEPASLPGKFGYPLSIAAAAGAVLLFVRRRRRPVDGAVTTALGLLLALFVVLEYGVRLATSRWLGKEIAPFTPGRFLIDATPLLALLAGLAFAALAERLRRGPAAVVVFLLLCAVPTWPALRESLRQPLEPARAEAYAWIREHAPPDAVVLGGHLAAAWLTRRPASEMPYPSSEPLVAGGVRAMVRRAKEGVPPPDVPPRHVLLVRRRAAKSFPVLWSHPDGMVVQRLYPPGP